MVTFAVIGLVLAVLITASVVAAAVVASYRRIGVLKSIGFTPAQVTAAYLAQIGLPALAGAVAGTAVGVWRVLPLVNGGSSLFNITVTVPLWIDITVPLGMLALTGVAAAGGDAGRAAAGRRGDRGRAGPARRPWVCRPPAGRPDAAAPAGDGRAGRPFHPARPLGGHPGRDHVRADRGGARHRPGCLARQDQPRR